MAKNNTISKTDFEQWFETYLASIVQGIQLRLDDGNHYHYYFGTSSKS